VESADHPFSHVTLRLRSRVKYGLICGRCWIHVLLISSIFCAFENAGARLGAGGSWQLCGIPPCLFWSRCDKGTPACLLILAPIHTLFYSSLSTNNVIRFWKIPSLNDVMQSAQKYRARQKIQLCARSTHYCKQGHILEPP